MEIHLSHDEHWAEVDGTWVHGDAFINGKLFSSTELAKKISAIDDKSELKEILGQARGFFSILHDLGDRIFLAVDHIRSWPVYYATTDEIYISDSAEWVHEIGANRGYDPVAATEYLFTSYVPGSKTLSRDVKQVQAGEIVTLHGDQSDQRTVRESYFVHNPADSSIEIETADLDRIVTEICSDLIEYADGRTILLGLSSGYDSRLIALVLSRLGYDNVVTYTTDTASGSSSDIPVARSVATDLGYEHLEIRYDNSDFEFFERSERLQEFVRDIGFLSEYPQVHKLVEHEKLTAAGISPEDVVHVMGHHALGGATQIPRRVAEQDTVTRTEFFDLLWKFHYSNWNEPAGSRWRELFEGYILDRGPSNLYSNRTVEASPGAVSGLELWYWQERLPKYLTARREYASLGYDSWNPLLDRRFYDFLEGTSHRSRVGKRVLKEYVYELDVEIRGSSDLDVSASDDSPQSIEAKMWQNVIRLVGELPEPVEKPIRQTYRDQQSKTAYETDARYGIVPESDFNTISFRKIHYRPLLFLLLYKNGFFELPGTTELDRALGENQQHREIRSGG